MSLVVLNQDISICMLLPTAQGGAKEGLGEGRGNHMVWKVYIY